MYEWAYIIFPLEGDIRLYSETLEKLETLVRGWNVTANFNGGEFCMSLTNVPPKFTTNRSRYVETDSEAVLNLTRVKMACGHNTRAADAEELIDSVDLMLFCVMENSVQEIDQGDERGEPQISYTKDDRKINFFGPKRYFEDFRSDGEAMKRLRERQTKE
jgi:hypothetical protein